MKKSLIGNVPPDKVSLLLRPSHTDADGNRIKPPRILRQTLMMFVGMTILIIVIMILELFFPVEESNGSWISPLIAC